MAIEEDAVTVAIAIVSSSFWIQPRYHEKGYLDTCFIRGVTLISQFLFNYFNCFSELTKKKKKIHGYGKKIGIIWRMVFLSFS